MMMFIVDPDFSSIEALIWGSFFYYFGFFYYFLTLAAAYASSSENESISE